jgi:hypothetical protein
VLVEGSLNGHCRYVRAAPTAMAIRPSISLPLPPTSAHDHARGPGQPRVLGLNSERATARTASPRAECNLKLANRRGTRVMPQAGIWALFRRLEGPTVRAAWLTGDASAVRAGPAGRGRGGGGGGGCATVPFRFG